MTLEIYYSKIVTIKIGNLQLVL